MADAIRVRDVIRWAWQTREKSALATRRFDVSEKENTPPQFAPSAEGGGLIVYGWLKTFVGIHLDAEDEFNSTDLTIHKIAASAVRVTLW